MAKDRIYSYYLSIKSRFRKYLTIKLFLYNNKLVKTRIIHHYFCLMCFLLRKVGILYPSADNNYIPYTNYSFETNPPFLLPHFNYKKF